AAGEDGPRRLQQAAAGVLLALLAGQARLRGVGHVAMISAPRPGTSVITRRPTRSLSGAAGRRRTVATIARSTARISVSAKLAPRQRRIPPPNGRKV